MHTSSNARPANRPDFVVDGRGRVRIGRAAPSNGIAVLGLAVATSLAVAAPGAEFGNGLVALSRAASNAAEILRSRSPGLRLNYFLTKTKSAPRARPRFRPRPVAPRRVIPAPRPAMILSPPPEATPLRFADLDIAPTGPVNVTGPFPTYDLEDTACLCRFAYLPPIGGGGFIIGGGGGGGVTVPPPPPGGGGGITPPPGVPEPSSWTMMILGFGALGTIWRRRKRLVSVLRLTCSGRLLAARIGFRPRETSTASDRYEAYTKGAFR